MNERIIADIHLFRSDSRTENGHFNTVSFGDKKLNAVVRRIVMKLRENAFSMGDFDHLYINFTACELAEPMVLSRAADRYHPWFRECDVWVEREIYDCLRSDEVVQRIRDVLTAFFAGEDFYESKISDCINEAVTAGEEMLMRFKEKITAKRRAVIYLRYLDSCRYRPLVRVYDLEEHLLLERDLPEMVTLDELGELQVGLKKVTVKPRKNAFTTGKKPLVFEY